MEHADRVEHAEAPDDATDSFPRVDVSVHEACSYVDDDGEQEPDVYVHALSLEMVAYI